MPLHVVEPGSGEEIILVLGLGLALAVAGGESPGGYERSVVELSRDNTAVINLFLVPDKTPSAASRPAPGRGHTRGRI